MSTLPDNEFDLEKLFLPAWAQEPPRPSTPTTRGKNRASSAALNGAVLGRPAARAPLPAPGRKPPAPRRPPGLARPETGRDRLAPGGRGPAPAARASEQHEPPPPLPEINVSLLPDEKGVESLARQIKMTGRAYPLFDIAQMILQKPERHRRGFQCQEERRRKAVQPLFVCALDDTLWLSDDEASAMC